MIADWFDGVGDKGSGPALALKVMLDTSLLLVLAWVVHTALGRRRALIRSGLWNAVLIALSCRRP
jgi:hypothetical protein